MGKFWSFIENPDNTDEVELRIDGDIVPDDDFWSWLFGLQTVTPGGFREQLAQHAGKNITVWINSYGGDTAAASQIYTALKEHKGTVTTKVEGVAISAASVIAMAGQKTYMSPTSIMMIHNPWSELQGEAKDFRHVADVLDEVKESIINAYQLKSGKSRAKISKMMDEETWMSAKKALSEGFIDGILYTDSQQAPDPAENSFMFSRVAVLNKASESTRRFIEQYKQKLNKYRPVKNEISSDDFKGTPFADLPVTKDEWNPNGDTDADIINEILGPNGDDWEAMKKTHLAYAPGEDYGGDPPTQRNAYKLKIARRRNGILTVYWSMLVSRVGILNGARGGVNISKEAKQEAWDHAMKYYEKFGVPKEEWPEPQFDMQSKIKEDEELKIETVGELKEHFPNLVAQVEAAARDEGTKEERKRMQGIDEIAATIAPELVARAKYEQPMTAPELAFESLKADADRGRQYLNNIKQDNAASGVEKVAGQPQDQQTTKEKEDEERKNNAQGIAGFINLKRGSK